MPRAKDHPALEPLRLRAAEEEAAYAAALAELDRLAAQAVPDTTDGAREGLRELNSLGSPPPAPTGVLARSLSALRRRLRDAFFPDREWQARRVAALVRLCDGLLERQAGLEAGLRALGAGLVRYAQRIEPVMDARDKANAAEAPSDADRVLQEFERQLEAVRGRTEALLALRDRVEVLSEQMRACGGPPPAAEHDQAVRPVARAAEDSIYTAFENRFRGSREEVRARQADYVQLFRSGGPVLDLGCGRGEFLDLLRAEGIEARGVEANANAVRECRERGHAVVQADVVDALRAQPEASLGGVFAAQLVEHLPPAALWALLSQAHRALRRGGLLVLETINAASALAFLDVFIRDLTHERPLHPETLRFLAAAAGFGEARIELRSPVPADVRLRLLPSGALAPPVVQVLNENAERLNALLFAPRDYALVATR